MEEGLLYGKSSGGGGNLLWGNVYSMKPVFSKLRYQQMEFVVALRIKPPVAKKDEVY
jgi:hypothetical protein